MKVTETFAEALARVNRSNCARIPTPQMAVLRRAVAHLRRSGILERCLQTGETAPDFEFIDFNNNHTSLYSLLGTGPVVINFFRGYWCSYCEQELIAYRRVQDTIRQLGAHYLAVSPCQQIPESLQDLAGDMVCDCDNQIARSWGIVYELTTPERELFREWQLNLDEVNQSARWELPLPATYVVAPDHSIEFQYVDADFRSRLDPDEIIDVLKNLLVSSAST